MAGPESVWSASKWMPTQVGFDKESVDLDELRSLRMELRKHTRFIISTPYAPLNWLARGLTFLQLGYPELALGDFLKARILTKEAQRYDSPVGAAALLMIGKGIVAGEHEVLKLQDTAAVADEDFPGMKSAVVIAKQMEYNILQSSISALRAVGELHQAYQMCKDSRIDHPEAAEYQLLEMGLPRCLIDEELHPDRHAGQIHRRVYPWMTKDLLHRNKETLAIIQKEFGGVKASLEVRQSMFLQSLFPKDPPSDLYGVHTIENIFKDTVVFIDHGLLFATAAPGRCPTCAEPLPSESSRHKCGGCKRAFCSESCWWRAAVDIHDPLCGRDFSYLYTAAKNTAKDPEANSMTALEPLLLVRVLATMMHPDTMHMLFDLHATLPPHMARIVEDNAKSWTRTDPTDHPLTQPVVARLTANYNSDAPVPFSYEHQIVTPTRILQTLGIDIFANLAYDTWVLETIRHRICNNRLGGILSGRKGRKPHHLLILHTCYAMLNHSCEPNCGVAATLAGGPPVVGSDGKVCPVKERANDGASIMIVASRDIKKGEELFISYFADFETMPREERQRRLSTWFGEGGCKCARCEREKEEAEAEVKSVNEVVEAEVKPVSEVEVVIEVEVESA